MAAGWFDYLRQLLGRVSAFNPTTGRPYRVAAGQTFCSGAVDGETFNTGIATGEVDGRAS